MGTIRNGVNGIDYAYAAFSQGPLSGIADVAILAEPPKLVMSWSTSVLKANTFPTDEVHFLVYEPVSSDYVIGPPSIPRSAQTADIAMPSDWAGRTVHVFVYCRSLEKQDVSDSIFYAFVLVSDFTGFFLFLEASGTGHGLFCSNGFKVKLVAINPVIRADDCHINM